jgi:hypothetical protein
MNMLRKYFENYGFEVLILDEKVGNIVLLLRYVE